MEVLDHYQREKKYTFHEFVIMPDHLHLLISPAKEISLERAMQLIKGGFSYRFGQLEMKRGWVWQESFTNHRVRDEDDYERHAMYMRMNPVRARLVGTAEEYPYSSASRSGRAAIYGRVAG
jgi:putative transposase